MFGQRGRMNARLTILAAVFALSGIGLAGRIVYIQTMESSHYEADARNEHFGQQEIRAPRGAILDRNGYPLATTVDAYDVYVNRADWQDVDAARKAADVIAPLIGRKPDDLVNDVRKEATGIFFAYGGLDIDKGRSLQDADAPGLRLVQTTKRFYPEGDLASTLLGFVGRDHVGLTGIEADFDSELGGTPGTIYFERDSIGNRIALGSERVGQKPIPGGNIRLTIDRYIQRLVETELDTQIAKTGALGGSIIVMDPKTGEVLAMASRPGFQLSKLDLNNPNQALFRNRAVTDVYEPGSVFKTLTASIAIDQGLVTPESTYVDTGVATIGSSTIHNWDYSVNGTTTVTQVLQRSLNTGAVWMSGLIGPDTFYDYVKRFGIGTATGVGLGGEPDGLVRTNADPGWSEVDLATNSFGQGIAATPLQIITAIAAIPNHGMLMRPYIVKEMDTQEGPRTFSPVPVRQVIKEETANAVADMMNQVVEGVPGHLAAIKGYHVAGKTGTSTGATLADGAVHDGNVASFVGFAPVNDPKMITLIKLDFKEDRLGGQVSAPVFADIAPSILAYLGVRPIGPQLVTTGN
ncbi:MAG: penicillin-binding protein 2 [Dehalococcoidia bacterium]|nr:MAG: penicillin-binding protein 2 [Dehalococcoidia bacterium]